MEYVFEKMHFHKMYTSVLENNIEALNLYKKFGFKEEGRLLKHILRDKNYIDIFLIGAFREDWEKIKTYLPVSDFISKSGEIE